MSKARLLAIYVKRTFLRALGTAMIGVLSLSGFDTVSEQFIPGFDFETDAIVSMFIAGFAGVFVPAGKKLFEDLSEDGDLDLEYVKVKKSDLPYKNAPIREHAFEEWEVEEDGMDDSYVMSGPIVLPPRVEEKVDTDDDISDSTNNVPDRIQLELAVRQVLEERYAEMQLSDGTKVLVPRQIE